MAQTAVAVRREPTSADIPRLLEELRGLVQSKLRRPVDPDIDFLTTQIEVASMSQADISIRDPEEERNFEAWKPYGLTPQELQVASRLKSRFGKPVSLMQMMGWIYPDGTREPPDKIISVWVCKLRKKLRNSPYAIENVWGRGYMMVARNGEDQERSCSLKHWRDGVHLGPVQLRIAEALLQAKGAWLHGHQVPGLASANIIHLRKRLAGSRYKVESERGFGFRMVVGPA